MNQPIEREIKFRARYNIEQEGVLHPNGSILAPGAVHLDHDYVPVTFGFGGEAIGRASKLGRDKDGNISVEVELFYDLGHAFSTSHTCDQVQIEKPDAELGEDNPVTSMRLRVVRYLPDGYNFPPVSIVDEEG